MLNADPRKLRFLGIDMHSRARRRCMVVLTYLVYFIAMAVITEETKTVALLQSHHSGFWLMVTVSIIVAGFGIFREGGPVKRFQDQGFRMRGMKGGVVMLGSLDDRAKYKYGDAFDALSEERQKELLRTYKVGNYLFPADRSMAPDRPDERDIAVRGRASITTLKFLAIFCACSAESIAFGNRIQPIGAAQLLLMLSLVAITGPKAIILWSEPDPRSCADPQLVQQPSA